MSIIPSTDSLTPTNLPKCPYEHLGKFVFFYLGMRVGEKACISSKYAI